MIWLSGARCKLCSSATLCARTRMTRILSRLPFSASGWSVACTCRGAILYPAFHRHASAEVTETSVPSQWHAVRIEWFIFYHHSHLPSESKLTPLLSPSLPETFWFGL